MVARVLLLLLTSWANTSPSDTFRSGPHA